jgi:KipI family sensor histidine kinase inhibitor
MIDSRAGGVTVRWFGNTALLCEPAEPADVLPLAAALRRRAGLVEVIPAARTVLVEGDRDVLARLADEVGDLRLDRLPAPDGDAVDLDVDYDGPDLESSAATLGLDPGELVRRHAGGNYVVAFCGFAPGFAYLTGLAAELHVARLPEPRTRVPAGSVGIAGEFTGVYPRASPGGWRLLGRTDAVLWDQDRRPPALLPPGTRVRFRPR